MDKIEQIKKLVQELNKASDLYYNTDKPMMNDKAWDDSFDLLKQLEQETNFIMADSPTQKIGYEVKSKLEKVEHSIPLKSLGKTKEINELIKFINNKEILVMLKGDGLTCELIYNNGELMQGSTRGNGEIGEDITHNVKTFKNIPLKIDFKGYIKLAGEAVIFENDFIAINNKLKDEDKYSHSRNLVAGSVRQLDSKICANRNVNFMAFSLLECKDENGNNIKFNTLEGQFLFLSKLGFYIISHTKIENKIDTKKLSIIIKNLQQYATDNGTPIDGLVLGFNDLEYANSLGETLHHPLSKIAFKFYDDEYETKYIRTEWQVSRTSMINPVGVFEPVDLDGAVTTKATLHNIDYFEGLQLGKGNIITVARQNQVIPKILDNKTRSNTEIIPTECPICHSKTEIKLLKTARVLICTNENCPSKKVAQIEHYCSRDAMNIVGLSEATIEKFIDKGFIKNIPDIYKLDQHKKEIISMEGFGLKSYNKLIESINNSKECSLNNFILGLGIPNVGKKTAKDLAKTFKTIDSFKICTEKQLIKIDDIGDTTADSVIEWLNNDKNKQLLDELLQHITFKEEKEVEIKAENINNPLFGKHIYLTGKFSLKKDELKQKLENVGAIVESGYKKSLDYLILGGDTSKSGKADKAMKDGVKMMSEEEMLKYLEQ